MFRPIFRGAGQANCCRARNPKKYQAWIGQVIPCPKKRRGLVFYICVMSYFIFCDICFVKLKKRLGWKTQPFQQPRFVDPFRQDFELQGLLRLFAQDIPPNHGLEAMDAMGAVNFGGRSAVETRWKISKASQCILVCGTYIAQMKNLFQCHPQLIQDLWRPTDPQPGHNGQISLGVVGIDLTLPRDQLCIGAELKTNCCQASLVQRPWGKHKCDTLGHLLAVVLASLLRNHVSGLGNSYKKYGLILASAVEDDLGTTTLLHPLYALGAPVGGIPCGHMSHLDSWNLDEVGTVVVDPVADCGTLFLQVARTRPDCWVAPPRSRRSWQTAAVAINNW